MSDIERKIDKLKKESQDPNVKKLEEALEKAKDPLSQFSSSLEKLLRHLRGLPEDKRIKEIKRLAALIVAPDSRSLNIRDILWK